MRSLTARISSEDGHRVFVLSVFAYVAFSLLDWITTTVALADGGREGNPLARSLYAQYGSAGLLAFKALVVAIIIAALAFIPRRIMSERVATWLAVAFAIAVAITSVHNIQALTALQQGGFRGAEGGIRLL